MLSSTVNAHNGDTAKQPGAKGKPQKGVSKNSDPSHRSWLLWGVCYRLPHGSSLSQPRTTIEAPTHSRAGSLHQLFRSQRKAVRHYAHTRRHLGCLEHGKSGVGKPPESTGPSRPMGATVRSVATAASRKVVLPAPQGAGGPAGPGYANLSTCASWLATRSGPRLPLMSSRVPEKPTLRCGKALVQTAGLYLPPATRIR